jgi:hypothetical protein
MDLRTYLSAYPREVMAGDAPAVFDRYHTPDFVLTSDGIPLDRERLLAHVRPAGRRVESVSVTVNEALRVGDRSPPCTC